MFTSDFTDFTDVFGFCHQMNPMNRMAGEMYCLVHLVSSGDYKTTYFTKDNLCNQCNLLTKEKTSCCPCYPLAIIISVGKEISVQSVKSDVKHISAVNPQPPMAVSDRHPKCRQMRRER